MGEKAFPSGFTLNAAPASTKKIMLDGLEYATVAGLAKSPLIVPVAIPTTASFATSQTLPAPAAIVSSGLTSGELTDFAAASFPGGTAMTLAATAGAAYSTGAWFLDEVVPLEELDELEVYLSATTPTLGDGCYVGLMFCADATTGNAITCTVGYDAAGVVGLQVSRGDAPGGALIATAAPSLAAGWLRIKVLGSRPVSADPPALIFQYEFTAVDGTQVRETLTTLGIDAVSTWTASWDTADCDRVGLVLQAGAGAANPISGFATGLRIKRKAA